jgi:4-amino-4-deoxy-L-arabinose transferase-like glycosyltransferase
VFKLDKNLKIVIAIFLLALFLRLFRLSTFPVGFHIDEVKVGWNALSILKTGKDDWGNKFALYYNSFGDFRPTGIFYVTIPSIALFGRNEFAVRFPAAFLGTLTIFPVYFLVLELLKKSKNLAFSIQHLALVASLLLAISPWHIGVSRATSEVIISMFLVLSGLCLFIHFLNQKQTKTLIGSLALLASSYFFYHTARLLVPMFIFIIGAYYWREIQKSHLTKTVLVSFTALSLLTGVLMLNKQARGRFSQVSIFNDLDVAYELSRMPFEEGPNKVFIARMFHNKPLVYLRRFVNEYSNYFSANFFLNSTVAKPNRYQTVGVGIVTYVELILFIAGLVFIAQKRGNILPLLLLLAAPIPAALTTEDAPNLHRALYMLPFICIIGTYSLNYISSFLPKKPFIQSTCYLLLFLNFIFFLHMYFVHNKVHLPLYRNVGAKELAIEINKIQKNYDKIILTNIPDDPYPWIAFFTEREPAIFNKDASSRDKGTWISENLVFTGIRCPSRDAFNQPSVRRLLVVDAEGCATESNLKENPNISLIKIMRPDETEVYNLWSKTE